MTAPSTRRAPLQARSSETVETILNAASALLARVPFEQITTSRIAEEAALSVGALYRFYKDKQEIFDAIAVRELAEFREPALP
ncbi:MAG: helix-turn-helix domain containing protein [Acidobacteria bacterium]|nr:helix-turn-helix domain containing protein [Acidobacteriota bacterium]